MDQIHDYEAAFIAMLNSYCVRRENCAEAFHHNKLKGHLTDSVPSRWTMAFSQGESRGAVSSHSYEHLNNEAHSIQEAFEMGGEANHVVNKT